jgi:hypothetical protein
MDRANGAGVPTAGVAGRAFRVAPVRCLVWGVVDKRGTRRP